MRKGRMDWTPPESGDPADNPSPSFLGGLAVDSVKNSSRRGLNLIDAKIIPQSRQHD